MLIEPNVNKFNKLLSSNENSRNIYCENRFVDFEGRNTLDKILSKTPIPENFDFLSIDIDGNDYHIWNSLKAYKPNVLVIEFNPTVPFDIEFIQPKDLTINQGQSLLALVNLGKTKGYELIATTNWNAFFIKKNFFKLFDINDNSPEAIHGKAPELTQIYQLLDGTLVLEGYKRMIVHDFPIDEESIQVIPRELRKFPTQLTPEEWALLKRLKKVFTT